jgi:hypothetical protein
MLADYPINLPLRIVKGIFDFFYFWYVTSSRDFWRREISFIRREEHDIGILINLKLLTQPIFGDYTVMGKLIGPVFRLGRVLFGALIILLSFAAIIIVYIIWLLLPLLALGMALENLLYILFQ